jgi:16S rRNA (guanine966-N2)-methyltransferase
VPDAGRVIAGRARGRRLAAPGEGTRPLGDRVKETLFAILEPILPGATFLDLFAGSGAAGIEALSRGATRAIFVDRDRAACAVIEANLRSTGLAGPAAIVRRSDAHVYLDGVGGRDGPFDVVVVDPPYDEPGLLDTALQRLGQPGLVAPDGRVVAKRSRRTTLPASIGLLASDRERRFGETTLVFYRRVAAPPVDRPADPPVDRPADQIEPDAGEDSNADGHGEVEEG